MKKTLLVFCIVGLFFLVSFNVTAIKITTGTIDKEYPMPVMSADPYFLQRYQNDYNNEDAAYIDPSLTSEVMTTSDYSILNLLYYIASDRNQGYCSNCWMWPSTSVLEIALRVQEGVTQNRLSVQYMNTCGELYPTTQIGCCEGGTISMLASFYRLTGIAVPWSNTNAHWQDFVWVGQCEQVTCDEIAKEPNYPIGSIASKRITTQNVPETTAINNIKNILHQNRGVYFSIFYADTIDLDNFRNFWRNQNENYVYDLDYYAGHAWNPDEAVGHALLIVGYHDDEATNNSDYWVLLNSWGTTSLRPNGLLRVGMHMDYSLRYENASTYTFGAETLNVTFGAEAPTTSITGPNKGKINTTYTFDVSAVDPQNDDVSYYINWGDGTNSGWLGPFDSGTEIQVGHSFTAQKNYTIKAKAKDIFGHEGKEQPLQIAIPYAYDIPFLFILQRLFERFPHAFPILRQVLGY